jgi:hypothetical protein
MQYHVEPRDADVWSIYSQSWASATHIDPALVNSLYKELESKCDVVIPMTHQLVALDRDLTKTGLFPLVRPTPLIAYHLPSNIQAKGFCRKDFLQPYLSTEGPWCHVTFRSWAVMTMSLTLRRLERPG